MFNQYEFGKSQEDVQRAVAKQHDENMRLLNRYYTGTLKNNTILYVKVVEILSGIGVKVKYIGSQEGIGQYVFGTMEMTVMDASDPNVGIVVGTSDDFSVNFVPATEYEFNFIRENIKDKLEHMFDD